MQKYQLKTTTLFLLGVGLFFFGSFTAGLGIIGKQNATIVLGALIFVFSFIPLFTSGTVEITEEGASVKTMLAVYRIRFADVEKVAAGNGNILLAARDGSRLVLPAPSYWRGSSKHEAMKMLFVKLQERNLSMKPDWKASFLFSKGTKVN